MLNSSPRLLPVVNGDFALVDTYCRYYLQPYQYAGSVRILRALSRCFWSPEDAIHLPNGTRRMAGVQTFSGHFHPSRWYVDHYYRRLGYSTLPILVMHVHLFPIIITRALTCA
jgi:hypothetical protein